MKNEDKIVEILTESLKKQDQQSELMGKQNKILSKHSEILDKHSEILSKHSELLGRLVESDEKQTLVLEQLVIRVEALNGKVDGPRSDFIKLFDFLQTKQDKLEDRVKRLEDGFFKV